MSMHKDNMADLLDIQLISLLEENATQTSEKLGEQLSTSSSTIRRRIKDLIKRRVIRIVAIPEPKKVGLPLIAVIAFQLSHEKIDAFLKMLSNRKDVKCLYATSGRFDAITLMWFASTEELYKFMERDVSKVEGVKATETFICLHVEKSF